MNVKMWVSFILIGIMLVLALEIFMPINLTGFAVGAPQNPGHPLSEIDVRNANNIPYEIPFLQFNGGGGSWQIGTDRSAEGFYIYDNAHTSNKFVISNTGHAYITEDFQISDNSNDEAILLLLNNMGQLRFQPGSGGDYNYASILSGNKDLNGNVGGIKFVGYNAGEMNDFQILSKNVYISGNVGIGANPGPYKLFVDGDLRALDLNVRDIDAIDIIGTSGTIGGVTLIGGTISSGSITSTGTIKSKDIVVTGGNIQTDGGAFIGNKIKAQTYFTIFCLFDEGYDKVSRVYYVFFDPVYPGEFCGEDIDRGSQLSCRQYFGACMH